MFGTCCSRNSARVPPARPARERTPPERQTPMLRPFLGPHSSSFERLTPLRILRRCLSTELRKAVLA
eukprot:1646113-Alexandrium_andersonii.AAC.1